ncbi:porimin isoform X1 [Ciconia boyciana]|uniref:porimin isoform X1 n=1 Tax=Ciconia boyciana TaxID=52775 RepID=UPI003BA29577
MQLLTGASCALQAVALLLLAPGSQMNNSSSTAPFTTVPDHKLQDNSSSSNLTVISSTQSTATSTVGTSTSTAHLNSTTNTPTSVTLTTQPTKTSQTTRSTTASSVTSSQLNITVVTTSKISFTSVTATSKSEVVITSRFDVGSFVGGIVLTLGALVILYIGCKTYHSRRGIQYRTIDFQPSWSCRLLIFSLWSVGAVQQIQAY